MTTTLIFLALFIVVGAFYYIIGDAIDRSQAARNLDLSMEGLFKALGLIAVCVGLISILPDQGFNASSAEAIASNQVESEINETEDKTEATVVEQASNSIYQDGVFQGQGRGFKGNITVEVEVESGEITRVEVVEHSDDKKWFDRANSVIPDSILDTQSADVDTVSGATYTSLGMIEGAENALSKSRAEVMASQQVEKAKIESADSAKDVVSEPAEVKTVTEENSISVEVKDTGVEEAPNVKAVTQEAVIEETVIKETVIKETVVEQVSDSIYQDGIFQGQGRGFKGNITMEVEVESGEITRVEVVDHRDDRKWFNRANRVIPDSIIEAQSADVDTVSGATYSSLGMIDGAKEALSKSRGE